MLNSIEIDEFRDVVLEVFPERGSSYYKHYLKILKNMEDFYEDMKDDENFNTGKRLETMLRESSVVMEEITSAQVFVSTIELQYKKHIRNLEVQLEQLLEMKKKEVERKYKEDLSKLSTMKAKDQFVKTLFMDDSEVGEATMGLDGINFNREVISFERKKAEAHLITIREHIHAIKKMLDRR